jgi:hypothetical protein
MRKVYLKTKTVSMVPVTVEREITIRLDDDADLDKIIDRLGKTKKNKPNSKFDVEDTNVTSIIQIGDTLVRREVITATDESFSNIEEAMLETLNKTYFSYKVLNAKVEDSK